MHETARDVLDSARVLPAFDLALTSRILHQEESNSLPLQQHEIVSTSMLSYGMSPTSFPSTAMYDVDEARKQSYIYRSTMYDQLTTPQMHQQMVRDRDLAAFSDGFTNLHNTFRLPLPSSFIPSITYLQHVPQLESSAGSFQKSIPQDSQKGKHKVKLHDIT